ncbi:MAG: ABC transporter permease [Oligoflexia bacterium]|nr:ABC transporter permease [Oligoflexia bacterium]
MKMLRLRGETEDASTEASQAAWARFLHEVGAPLSEQARTLGEIGALFARTLTELGSVRHRGPEVAHAIVQIGIGSLPIIVLSTVFAGLVVTNEIAWHMDLALHTVSMIPGITGQFILRELGIAIPALLLVSKVGASITAEVGTMRVTEQIDALKLLGIDPVRYLVVPRFVASLLSSACLTLIAISVTLVCALSVAVLRYNFSGLEYLNALRQYIGFTDLLCALTKGVTFGAIIPIVSCAYGFRCQGGAEGVGSATTNSVVTSTIAVILLDFLLTYAFTLLN